MNLKIITEANAPMQLKDFIRLSDPANFVSEQLYWYEIAKSDQRTITLKERKHGERYKLLKEAVLYTREKDGKASEIRMSHGCYLEFGFASGRSLNFIAALADNALVFGFDSCNGTGPGAFPERDFAFTKTIDPDSLKPGVFNAFDLSGQIYGEEQEDKTKPKYLKMKLKSRTKEEERPFIPFSPLCNAVLYIGEIKASLNEFVSKDLDDPKKEGDHIRFIFFDIGDEELIRQCLLRLEPWLIEDAVIITSHSLEETDFESEQSEIVPMAGTVHRYTQNSQGIGLWRNQFIQPPPENAGRAGERRLDHDESGYNVLHFASKNREKAFKNDLELKRLSEDWRAQGVRAVQSDSQILRVGIDVLRERFAKESSSGKQLYFLEFGFCSGRSLNFIAGLLKENEHLYGFDSGLGLPKRWRHKFPTGTFRYTQSFEKVQDSIKLNYVDCKFDENLRIPLDTPTPDDLFIPFIPHPKANLVMGYVEATLSAFVEAHLKDKENNCLAFIYVDTDLDTAAKHILKTLEPYILSEKTMIIFDEALNFEGTAGDFLENGSHDIGGKQAWMHHEYAALNEFASETEGYDVVAFNENGQQLMICLSS